MKTVMESLESAIGLFMVFLADMAALVFFALFHKRIKSGGGYRVAITWLLSKIVDR